MHIRYLTQINKNQFGTRVKLKQCKSNSFCPVENDCYFFFLSNAIFTSIKFYIYDENFQLDILVMEFCFKIEAIVYLKFTFLLLIFLYVIYYLFFNNSNYYLFFYKTIK